MISPESRLFCRLDGLTASTREQKRLTILSELGLLEAESVPVFDEATQTAAHFLNAPICFLGIMQQEREILKSAVGLSRLGLMNDLASSRQLPRTESFCTHVVDSQQVLAIGDTLTHPAFANSLLVHQYGIRAYLGVPLLSSNGHCVGALAVLDLEPRIFTKKDIEFLTLTARWSMGEFERQHCAKSPTGMSSPSPQADLLSNCSAATQIQMELLSQLTQELRTPLTSVMGMASVLIREIYGPLTLKQKEYLDIIHNSGQYLLSLVNEIVELAALDGASQPLNVAPVDIEMLCQQAINTLEQTANRREQQIRLTVEPGNRIWCLDKDKVRQLLYHLIFSLIQSASAGSIVRLHVSRKDNGLNIAVWVSHPWLGDGLANLEVCPYPISLPLMAGHSRSQTTTHELWLDIAGDDLDLIPITKPDQSLSPKSVESCPTDQLQHNLGLVLSRQIAELHGGQLLVQGSLESGYRYVVSLPHITVENGNL